MYAFEVKYSYQENIDGDLGVAEYQDEITIFTTADACDVIEKALSLISLLIAEWRDDEGVEHKSWREKIFIFGIDLLAEEG